MDHSIQALIEDFRAKAECDPGSAEASAEFFKNQLESLLHDTPEILSEALAQIDAAVAGGKSCKEVNPQ